jgi:hypothetical protein
MLRRSFYFALGLAAALTASQARAGIITSLYSTGVDNNHNPLSGGASDTHYTLVVSSDSAAPAGSDASVVESGTYPFPLWAANTSTARWIAPRPQQAEPNGAYNYQTTFTLESGLDPRTVLITGRISADDRTDGILVNGHAFSFKTPDTGFGRLYSFTLDGSAFPYFQSGLNTLVFETSNTHGSVTGLFVDMTGTARSVTPGPASRASAVPEPASVALLTISLGGLLAFRRLRKRSCIV